MLIRMAWRNIWRSPVRSLVIITSVSLGLVAGIFVLGLYEGMLWSRVRTVIDTEVAHLQVHHPKFKADYEAKYTLEVDTTQLMLPSIRAVSRRSITVGMLATSTGSSGVQIFGVQPKNENGVSQLSTKLVEGKGFIPAKRNQVLVGKKLADKMKLKIGSKLVLTFTDRESTIVSAAFRVGGIYQTDNTPLDERNVYVKRDDLNRLLSMDNECHELAILLKSDNSLDSVKSALQRQFPNYTVETWKDVSPETRLMIETTNQYSIIFIVIIMLALAFGIINTMLMAILERSREIGMLVALGMNKVRLFLLVLCETVMLTMAGVPFGFVAAWIIVKHYNQAGIDISSFSGEAMSGFGFSSIIRPEFPWSQLLLVIYIVMGTAVFASVFPSFKALRLQPVEAMRL